MRRIILIYILAFVPFASRAQGLGEDKITSIFKAITSMYVDSVDEEALVDAAINGMISTLDPHSTYLPRHLAIKAKQELESEYTGYGFEATVIGDTLTVIRTQCDGPADKAGLRPGDRILSIANIPTYGKSIDRKGIDNLMQIYKGYKLNFKVIQSAKGQPKILKIRSGKVQHSTVNDAFIINDNIGIIAISIFGQETGTEFRQTLQKIVKMGAKKLIIDLRNNRGGYVGSVSEIASCLISEEIDAVNIVSRDGKSTPYPTTYMSDVFTGELVILVDGNTASSAELLAAAVQDCDRGVVIGRPTYGKSLSQKTIRISDGSELLLSTSKCHSPSGRCIQREYHIDHKAYREAARNRIYSPLCTEPDSAAPLFHTLHRHRPVYGNSGVIPDICIRLDTLGQEILFERLVENRVFDYTAALTYKLTQGNPNAISDYGIAERICRTARQAGINCEIIEILEAPLIMARMKAEIERQKDCSTNIIMHTYKYDKDVLQAIRLLFDKKEYNKILKIEE
ncbi:MAG: hypothetical protein J6Y82_10720 [Bacteroidales bacterium]|nr:hypothetical protein [Bacteroidales bacterium]